MVYSTSDGKIALTFSTYMAIAGSAFGIFAVVLGFVFWSGGIVAKISDAQEVNSTLIHQIIEHEARADQEWNDIEYRVGQMEFRIGGTPVPHPRGR